MVCKTSPAKLTNKQLTNLFNLLLAGYERSARRITASAENEVKTFAALLEGFGDRFRQDCVIQKQRGQLALLGFTRTITGFINAKSTWQQEQRSFADSFNILAVLNLTDKEVRHSMVLAWLLDKDMDRQGTHAQGSWGFEQFLTALALPMKYAEANYWVRREVAGDESRVDIEVAARDVFLIHIENKIWSGEGAEQTTREWADVERRRVALNVSPDHVHCIYLTPDGRSAGHKDFKALSWHKIETVLESFAEKALPEDVKLFARHYARALRAAGISQNQEKEQNYDE